jgi:hypothetical protein
LHYNGMGWDKCEVTGTFPSLRSVFFEDENHGISSGYCGTILTYSDNHWNIEKPLTDQHLNASFIVKDNSYVVGDNGTIISNNPFYENALTDNTNNEPDGSTIHVFPNPCDSYMELSFLVEKDNSPVQVSFTNAQGQIIKVMNMNLDAGNHNLHFSTDVFVNGNYILCLTINDATDKTKFIIQH